jgi:hypothetical protein
MAFFFIISAALELKANRPNFLLIVSIGALDFLALVFS